MGNNQGTEPPAPEPEEKKTTRTTRSVSQGLKRARDSNSSPKHDGEHKTPAVSDNPFGVTRKRIALCIGNSNYSGDLKLKNPISDAKILGAKLSRECGFEVTTVFDANRAEMASAIDDFCDRLAKETQDGVDVAGLFFYAGHAVQVNGENFLIPIGIPPVKKPTDIVYNALELDFLLSHLEMAANNCNVIVLDCCREDPFNDPSKTRGIARRGGLAPVRNPRGHIVAFSCAPGTFAQDSPDSNNSVYTSALLRHIATKGKKLVDVLQDVTNDVVKDTSGEQTPFYVSSMTSHLEFRNVEEVATQCHVEATYEEEQHTDAWGYLESLNPKYPSVYLDKRVGNDVKIGRQETCTVVIPDSTVISRVHCVLRKQGAQFTVECLGMNGVWINRQEVKKGDTVAICSGDVLTVQKAVKKSKSPKISYKFYEEGAFPSQFSTFSGTLDAAVLESPSKRRKVSHSREGAADDD